MVNSKMIQFCLIQGIRKFFEQNNFVDVLTPPAVQNPGTEPHLHPFQLSQKKDDQLFPYYLHTSPEFSMKQLLSEGAKKIFTINYCFRDEPRSENHRFQFIMLEWYRANENYLKIMDDCEQLIIFLVKHLQSNNVKTSFEFNTLEKITVRKLFQEILNIDLYELLTIKQIKSYLKTEHSELQVLPNNSLWEDYYFLLFLNKIEPLLKSRPAILIYEFPFHLKALSTIKKDDPNVCERFEIYLDGIEVCNCFNELTDLHEQTNRILEDEKTKKNLYQYNLGKPNQLLEALEKGIPPSSGIALGVERLLKVLTGIENPFWD
jgi:lysyl-tRNA synthetase class 2